MFGAFKVKIASFLCSLWIRCLRVRLTKPEGYRAGVIGSWHRDLMACCAAFRGAGVHVLVSQSRDGEIFARVTSALGYRVTRGSDSRGALNVRHLRKTLDDGEFVAMALDGPRGPAGEIKPGSLWLSRSSGRPLWIAEVSYGRHFTLKTWDNFVVPLPLTTVDIRINYFMEKEKNQDKETRL